MKPVTDPAILEQLDAVPAGLRPVTDPALLKSLSDETPPPGYGGASVDTSDPRPMWDFAADTSRAFNESLQSLKNREPGGLGSSLGMARDIIGMAASPITGGIHSAFGSAFSYLPIGIDDQGIKTLGKTRGDAMADAGMMGLGPRGLSAGKVVASTAKPPVPTVADLKAASDKQYTAGRASGLEIDPASTKNLASQIETTLLEAHDPIVQPKTFAIIKKLGEPTGETMGINRIDSVRRVLGDIAGDPAEKVAAVKAIRAIDDYMGAVPKEAVIAGDAAATNALFTEGRANVAAYKRAGAVEKAVEDARLRAGSTNSGRNIDNATRQELRKILMDPDVTRGFSPEELAQLEKVVMGSATGNALRTLGNMFGGGGGMGASVGSYMGYSTMGPLGIAVPAVGQGIKAISNLSTARQAKKLDEMLRSRSPLGQALGQQQFGPPAPRSPIMDGISFGIENESLMRKERLRAE